MYCFDALMKDRLVYEVEFAEFPDEFDVAQHLALGDAPLLLLLGGEGAVMLFVDWRESGQEATV